MSKRHPAGLHYLRDLGLRYLHGLVLAALFTCRPVVQVVRVFFVGYLAKKSSREHLHHRLVLTLLTLATRELEQLLLLSTNLCASNDYLLFFVSLL